MNSKVNNLLETVNKHLETITAQSQEISTCEKDKRAVEDELRKIKENQQKGDKSSMDVIARLTSTIKSKDDNIELLTVEKGKLETYTKQTLHKFQDKYLIALQQCKQKLKDKHERIEVLERKAEKEKIAHERALESGYMRWRHGELGRHSIDCSCVLCHDCDHTDFVIVKNPQCFCVRCDVCRKNGWFISISSHGGTTCS